MIEATNKLRRGLLGLEKKKKGHPVAGLFNGGTTKRWATGSCNLYKFLNGFLVGG